MKQLTITRADVVQAAAEKGVPVLQALTAMQGAAAKLSNDSVLRQLCAIKSEILFGN